MVRLLERIKEHVAASSGGMRIDRAGRQPGAPITEREISQFESWLGFKLPSLLHAIFLEVGNGGFGPAEGFLPIRNDKSTPGIDLLKVYNGCRQSNGWPPHLLPIVYTGCDVFFCVDCDHSKYRVIMFDGDLGCLHESDISEPREKWPYPDSPLALCFRVRAKSLEDFMEMWLADETQLYRWG